MSAWTTSTTARVSEILDIARAEELLGACLARVEAPVLAAYLFGSQARGQATPLSDIDVAVYLDEPDRQRRVGLYLALKRSLERALQVANSREMPPIDLVYINDAPPALAARMIAGRLIYCQDEVRRVRLERQLLSQYFDLAPLLKTYERYLRQRIQGQALGKGSGNMIDLQSVYDRLAYIEATLQQLSRRQSLSKDALAADADRRGATCYELQTCIEAMSDIANHIIAATGLPKPRTRGEAFTILAEAGVLPAELAERLAQTVGMRNVLVHGYLDIVLDLVYQTLQHDLPLIEAFTQAIVAYVSPKP